MFIEVRERLVSTCCNAAEDVWFFSGKYIDMAQQTSMQPHPYHLKGKNSSLTSFFKYGNNVQ